MFDFSQVDQSVIRSFDDLRSSGFVWAVNHYLFHPMGCAFTVWTDDDGKITGWSITDGITGFDKTDPEMREKIERAEAAAHELFPGSILPSDVLPGQRVIS